MRIIIITWRRRRGRCTNNRTRLKTIVPISCIIITMYYSIIAEEHVVDRENKNC